MKLTIIDILRKNIDKDGRPLITKDNRPYERLAIKVSEKDYEGKWLSGFSSNWNAEWKIGDVVNINVEKVEKDGNTYFNFSRIDEFEELKLRVEKLENYVFGAGVMPTDADPKEDIEEENLPF